MNIQSALEISRIALGAGLVLANVAVWYGVYLEKEEFPKEVQERGWLILIRALAAEAALAFVLLAEDTVISRIQSQEIAAAETRAANVDLEAGRLGVDVHNLRGFVSSQERQITSQFDRFRKFAADEAAKTAAVISDLNAAKARLNQSRDDAIAAAKSAKADLATILTSLKQEEQNLEQEKRALEPRDIPENLRDDFVTKMKAFSGLTVNLLVPPSTTPDTGPLATLLGDLLSKAGWKVGYMQTLGGWSKKVVVCVGKSPPPNVVQAAVTLVLGLRQAGIEAFANKEMGPDVRASGAGNVLPNPNMTILVGSKQ